MREVRDTIELACVVRVAGCIHQPGRADALRAAAVIDADLAAPGCGGSEDLHTAVAELGGSPLLRVFVQRLWVPDPTAGPPILGDPTATVALIGRRKQARSAVADAILDGDVALARYAMKRRLDPRSASR